MSKQDNSGPAFPAPMIPCDNQGGYTEVRHTGMSLRDYFAAKAMQGLIDSGYDTWEDLSHDSFALADAMLKARNQ